MSCNGCRVLRKGCSDSCILRSCLHWIDGAEAQGHATVFVAKFFGRAGLMSFISAVPEPQRAALFQSLLYEACGRTINPVNGAVGLMWSGSWHHCEAAVETVLRGGVPRLVDGGDAGSPGVYSTGRRAGACSTFSTAKRVRLAPPEAASEKAKKRELELWLSPTSPVAAAMRPTTPSMNSEDSVTTAPAADEYPEPRLLNLFG